ncbi:hypothetical protein QBC36DRAFT_348456 [Triangularia setosa]|uniref:Rhodopsin domain-containing protein n=1 Tax=Triangularia setosa TaxID=2587417 RepID=A0AAN6W3W1_9PEZI|nr:hypothetical protein QBC36DRAFT_348456 [Podospora setosa]
MAYGNLPGENRAYQIEAPCIIFFVLTPIFVGIRLWARIKLRGWSRLGLDDWTIVVSTGKANSLFKISATNVSALMVASCTYGFGQHIGNLTKPNKLMTLKLFYVAQTFYKLTINLTKASILLLYLRIFPKQLFRTTCFDRSIPGTCISITANWYANATFSITTDLIILGLPMHSIYTSHLPTSQKLALMAVFALVCACLPVCRLPLSYILPSYFPTSSSPAFSSSMPAMKMKPRIHIVASSSSTQEFNGHISDAEVSYEERRYGQYGADKCVIETRIGAAMPPSTPVRPNTSRSGSSKAEEWAEQQRKQHEQQGFDGDVSRKNFQTSVYAGRGGRNSDAEADGQNEGAIQMVKNYCVLSDGREVL